MYWLLERVLGWYVWLVESEEILMSFRERWEVFLCLGASVELSFLGLLVGSLRK